MNTSTKIIIGIIIGIGVIFGGYFLLRGPDNNSSSADTTRQKVNEGGSGVRDHFQAAIEHFGF